MALFGWTSWKVWMWQRSTAEFEFTGIINDPIRGKCKPAFVERRRRLLRLQMACRSVARAERVSRGTASINPVLSSSPAPVPIENQRLLALNALRQISTAAGKYSVPA
ncbi:ribosome biogenesis bop1-like protein [Labeo rohita]|uniref:Ribosome biogenesis bop1-like protein n=1 Tax=Labeo rohita TaxID=84645 RepID=A0A498M889_LABRO|nr:ribosome biogenesis bop1-like protein [Labeo rohita]